MRYLVLLLLLPLAVQAQQAPEYVNVNLVQPQAWQIPGLPEAGVDAGGDLNLSIPILSVPGRGLNYDINFSYNSNITLRQQASWLGLGWSFDPGSITREPSGGGVASKAANPSELHYYGVDAFDTETGDNRVQPDVYYLSIPGRGTVQFTQSNKSSFFSQTIPNFSDGDFYTDEHRSWKIEGFKYGAAFKSCDIDDGNNDGQCNISVSAGSRPSTTADDFFRFIVTTDDGTRYVYEAPTLAAFKTAETVMGTNSAFRQKYVNTWRLRAILSSRYGGPVIPEDGREGQWIRLDWSGVYHGKINDENDFSETRFLKAIVTPTHRAEFVIAPRSEENLATFISANRTPDTDNYLYQRLTKIELKRSATGSPIRSVEITQNKNAFGPAQESLKKRLGLDAIKFLDSNGSEQFRFSMSYDCDVTFAGLDLWEMDDDFGFLHPAASGLTGCSNVSQPNVWRLTKLTFPAGGTESYSYEFDVITQFGSDTHIPKYKVWELFDASAIQNTYSLTGKDNYGGSRIQKITRADGVGGPDIITNYSYGWGYVTGVPHLTPTLESPGAPLFVPSSRARTRVSYGSVTSDLAGAGSTEISYTTSASHAGVDLVSTGVMKIDGGLVGTIIMQGNEDWNWGREYKRVLKADNGDLVNITETSFNFTRNTKQPAKIYFSPFEVHTKYVQSRVNSVTRKECGVNITLESNCNAVHTADYEYHEETIDGFLSTTNQIISITETSQDIVRTTNTTFAHEQYTDAGEMRDFNMLTQIYSTEIRDQNNSLKQKNWTIWSPGLALLSPSDLSEVWLPGEEWVWGGGAERVTPNTADELLFTYDEYNEDAFIYRGIDAAGTTSIYSWGHDGALPIAVTSTSSDGTVLSSSATYNDDTFLMESLTGLDGVTTHFTYDPLGRLKTIKETATASTPITEYIYVIQGELIGENNPNYIETILHSNSEPDQRSRTYFDGLGRSIQVITEESDSTTVTATYYDSQGRLWASWIPYRKQSFAYDNNPGTVGSSSRGTAGNYHNSDNPYNLNAYKSDPLSRPVSITSPGIFAAWPTIIDYGTGTIGSANYAFVLNEDENGNQVKTYTDTFGNTRRIDAPEGALTDFMYDALGNLTQVTNLDIRGTDDQHIYYTYDQRQRLIRKSTPDANGDGDSNLDNETNVTASDFEYQYDIRGNLRFLRDPNHRSAGNHYIYYKYDGHNRLIEEGVYTSSTGFDSNADSNDFPSSTDANKVVKAIYNYAGAQIELITFYDQDDNSSSYNYEYDSRGRISNLTIDLHGLTSKTIAYEYDLQGRITKILFENNKSDHFYHWYHYNKAGRLATVNAGEANNESLATNIATYDYWPNGQVRTLKLGDSVSPVQTLDYRYNIRGWLESINNPENLADDAFGLSLSYENKPSWLGSTESYLAYYNGNIGSAMWSTDALAPEGGDRLGYVFNYDELNRLSLADNHQYNTSWVNTNSFDVPTIIYDKMGNILSFERKDKDGAGNTNTYGYNAASNQLSSISNRTSTFSYDDNGNVLSGELNQGVNSSISYNYQNLPESITIGESSYLYSYDANGQRVYNSAAPSYYIRGISGEVMAVYDTNNSLRYWNLVANSELIGRQTK